MKLIILGNGFDLHHNYETSFNHFRTHLKNSIIAEDQNLLSKIDDLIKDDKSKQKYNLLWNDFESIIGEIMNTENYKSNTPSLIEEFTEKFYKYLLSISKIKTPQINSRLALEFENTDTVLSFNYTSFYSNYIKNSNINVFHIHGTLSSNNLPIIGYYYLGTSRDLESVDYSKRYGGKLIHKSALSYKQNEIDLDSRIREYIQLWKNKISEIVIVGYSFGSSDSHIYHILNKIMIKQRNSDFVPKSLSKSVKAVKFTIYSFNKDNSIQLIEKIKENLSKVGRRYSVKITGGIKSKEKNILTFELKEY